jgi:phospholipase/lecithinase/hemolysin
MPRRRSRRSSSAVIAALATGLWFVGAANGGQFTGIVSFGDSLSDVGNYSAATGGGLPPSPPYDAGRFANGPVWVDYLARDLGLPAPVASSAGGTDYALGGASTGPGTTPNTFPGTTVTVSAPNIDTQIATYLASNTAAAGQLFTIWGGANDFLNAGQTNPLIPAQNIANEIATLAGVGAKVFLVPNLPPMGDLPSTSSLPAPLPSELNALSIAFNTILQSEATQLDQTFGVQVHIVDVYSLMTDAMANPAKYGFTNVTDSALLSGSNGDGYLFWDTIHPTTQADQFIGALAAQSVPEPSSLVMLGTSLITVGGLATRLRRKSGCPARR